MLHCGRFIASRWFATANVFDLFGASEIRVGVVSQLPLLGSVRLGTDERHKELQSLAVESVCLGVLLTVVHLDCLRD